MQILSLLPGRPREPNLSNNLRTIDPPAPKPADRNEASWSQSVLKLIGNWGMKEMKEVDQRIWETPCPIQPVWIHDAEPDSGEILLEALNWAFNHLSDAGDGAVATPHTGDRGVRSKPIELWHCISGTQLRVRRSVDTVHTFILGPRRRILTNLIEAGREPPAAKALRFIRACEAHIRRAVDHQYHPDIDTYQQRLAAIEAFIRTSGRRESPATNAQIEMATPWSPLRAAELDKYGNRGKSLLVRSESMAWCLKPAVTCRFSTFGQSLKATIQPFTWEMRDHGAITDPVGDLRAIASLPRIRGR